MTPLAIVRELQRGDATPATWKALEALVRQRVDRVVRSAQDRDDIAQEVLYKFAEKALRGDLGITGESDDEVSGYISTMVRNGWFTQGRKAKRAPTLDDDAVAGAAVPSTVDEALDRERSARRGAELFARVAEAAIERTPPPNREARRVAWRQVEELFFDDITVDDLIARDEALDPGASRDDLKRAADRAMKQHQRFREAMLATALELARRGVISPEEQARVDRMVRELKRR